MVSEEVIANVIKNRSDAVVSDDNMSVREKLIRIDEISRMAKDIKLWGEVELIYNELGEI
jgi:hypothetical protein